eukprot:3862955-Prymnesium_polylepis.3
MTVSSREPSATSGTHGGAGAEGVRPTIVSPLSSRGAWRCRSAHVTQSMEATSAAPERSAAMDARWLPVTSACGSKKTIGDGSVD